MLQADFFHIKASHSEDNSLKAIVAFNEHHQIFKGHFPEQPIVPGVCMMQIVKEVIEGVVKQKTILKKAESLKFLAIINPLENREVKIELVYATAEDGAIKVDAQFLNEQTVFFKFKGSFIAS